MSGMTRNIITFQEINELHFAAENNQSALLGDFHIYRNEDSDETGRAIMPVHRCNFFQISLDQQSNYSLFVNDRELRTSSYAAYFVGRGKLVSWHSGQAREWKGYNVVFKPEFLYIGGDRSSFFKDFNFLRSDNEVPISLCPSDYASLADICEKMLYEQGMRPADKNILQHYLLILIFSLKRLYEKQKKITVFEAAGRESSLVTEFEQLVNDHYLDFRKVSFYAEKLFISPKYLSQLTRNIYGKSAKQMIMERLIEESRALLFQTNMTVNQIAFQLNFEDVSHFVKIFRNFTGSSPSEYRRKK
jgi:AraC family transcriptional regulator, transcriptional activator of pobA